MWLSGIWQELLDIAALEDQLQVGGIHGWIRNQGSLSLSCTEDPCTDHQTILKRKRQQLRHLYWAKGTSSTENPWVDRATKATTVQEQAKIANSNSQEYEIHEKKQWDRMIMPLGYRALTHSSSPSSSLALTPLRPRTPPRPPRKLTCVACSTLPGAATTGSARAT